MKLLICRFALSILLASSFATGAAGQVVATASPQNVPAPPNTATRGIIDGVRLKAIPGASFSARAKFESMQTLADGSTLAHHTFNIIARDSRGRTHNEFRQWNDPVTGAEGKLTYAILYDPDTRTRTYLYPAGHVARQYVFGTPDTSPAAPAASNPSEPTIQREDLGVRRDGDLQLTGTRETKTYPAGSIGNEQPLTLTTEYWYSPDLQINISVKRTDPRSGVQMVELTDLRRDEPDPSLFELPADYRVVNEAGGVAASATSDITTGGGAPERIRMGGNVQNVKLLNRVQPVYPLLARQTGIQGTVRLHAILGKDGTVQSLTLESGHPLLVRSALEAVSQWRYQPTLLNGNPVEVDTTIDVVFVLAAKPAAPELSTPVP